MTIAGDWNTPARAAVDSLGGIESSYDWASFISAYTSGRWDPLRTPDPPRPTVTSNSSSSDVSSATSSMYMSQSSFSSIDPFESSSQSHSPQQFGHVHSETEGGTGQMAGHSTKSQSALQPVFSTTAHRLRASVADLRPQRTSQPPLSSDNLPSSPSSSTEVVTAAATMRWAAARVNLAPLALPSPEHELTDPMRDHTTMIPGSQFSDLDRSVSYLAAHSPRKSPLASFWEGTKDVDKGHRLPTIQGSPTLDAQEPLSASTQYSVPLPASAPTEGSADIPKADYFGDTQALLQAAGKDAQRAFLHVAAPVAIPHPELGSLSVPASSPTSRSVLLTRQTSSPLPASTPLPPGGRATEGISVKAGKIPKEEQMFWEHGYLQPPCPPNESERQRALYKSVFHHNLDV